MKWRKQHNQILNKMNRKQEKELCDSLKDMDCGEWTTWNPDEMTIEEMFKQFYGESKSL